MSLDSIWRTLEQERAYSSIRRVDESHACDFFGALDTDGRRGLVLLSDKGLPPPPSLKSLLVESFLTETGKWQTEIWLLASELQVLFGTLCEDMISASRETEPADIDRFVGGRLSRWRQLFELAGRSVLAPSEIRGLLGELLVMQESFQFRKAAEVIEGWGGPLGAPQDFAISNLFIETKTVGPTALRAKIGSSDQLDAPYAKGLLLAVVRLAPVAANLSDGITLTGLIREVEEALQPFPGAIDVFFTKLTAVGYRPADEYDEMRFRKDTINYFSVRDDFPRIKRSDLMAGIEDASYEIQLSAIISFEVALGDAWN